MLLSNGMGIACMTLKLQNYRAVAMAAVLRRTGVQSVRGLISATNAKYKLHKKCPGAMAAMLW